MKAKKKSGSTKGKAGKRTVKDLPARKGENVRGGWSVSVLAGMVPAPKAPTAPTETIALPYGHPESTYVP